MASILQDLMEMVHDAIDTIRTAEGFINNDFILKKAFLPISDLTELHNKGCVTVIGLASDDTRGNRKSSEIYFVRETPIRVAVQGLVENTLDVDQIYPWLELEEQIRDAVAESPDQAKYTWMRHQSLKDENETPFNYIKLREASTVEAYFDSYFRAELIT